ncbi:MAG TPA: hypothetical protein PLA43_02890 [Bryobacteraceae bacterium]|nr:hypothetical protein [Bryobacteraceae bacterium]HPU70877.1 hypothetical protein [Bryobacteraceae bacterium]
MRRSTYTVALYLCLVFLSGILVGGFGMKLYSARAASAQTNPCSPEGMRQRYIQDMRTRLHLTDEQVKLFEDILEATGERFRALREKYRPEVKIIQEEQIERIRSILDESQRAEYEKLRAEREKRRPPENPRRPGC